MKLIALLTLLIPLTGVAEVALDEAWRCPLNETTTCMGEIWQENGHTFTIIGTSTRVLLASDTGIVWRGDSIGVVTAVARIDFGLGDGPEVLAATIGEHTGILHHYTGEMLQSGRSTSFGELTVEGVMPELSITDNRAAQGIKKFPTSAPDSLKRVLVLCSSSQIIDDMHSSSQSKAGVTWFVSLTRHEVTGSTFGGAPNTFLQTDFNVDGQEDLIAAGNSIYDRSSDDNLTNCYSNEVSMSVYEAGVDTIRKVVASSFSNQNPPNIRPGLSAICHYYQDRRERSIASISDSSGLWFDVYSLSTFERVSRSSRTLSVVWMTVSNQNGNDYLIAHARDGERHEKLSFYSLPDFVAIDEQDFPENKVNGMGIVSHRGRDQVDLIALTETDLVSYVIAPLGVEKSPARFMPSSLQLSSYPNPFNSSTTITYTLPRSGHYSLTVKDITGREVARLSEGWKEAGSYREVWEGSNVSSGQYIIGLSSQTESFSKPVTIIK